MSAKSLRFYSWWTPRFGVAVWIYCVRVHGNIMSSRMWVHGMVIHRFWRVWVELSLGLRPVKTHSLNQEM